MTSKQTQFLILLIAVLVALVACGGEGSGKTEKPDDKLRKAIRNISSLDGVNTNIEKEVLSRAIAVIKKSAEAGNVDAMFWMSEGRLLDSTDPNFVSLKDSLVWLEKAAKKGHLDAPFSLGDLFFSESTIKDPEKAYLWYSIGFYKKNKLNSPKDLNEEKKVEFMSEGNVSVLAKELGETKVKQLETQAWRWIATNTNKK